MGRGWINGTLSIYGWHLSNIQQQVINNVRRERERANDGERDRERLLNYVRVNIRGKHTFSVTHSHFSIFFLQSHTNTHTHTVSQCGSETATEATDRDQTENKYSWTKFSLLNWNEKLYWLAWGWEGSSKTTPNNPCSTQQNAVVKSARCNRPPACSLQYPALTPHS